MARRLSALQRLNILAPHRRILSRAMRIAHITDSLKSKYRAMDDQTLSDQTNILIEELKKGKTMDDIMPEAFAIAREACYRVHGIFAFTVQIAGAAIVHGGDFAEMCTGEGKTLVLVIVAYLNALLRKGIHIVSVNEYLVERDARFCAAALNPLGITVGYNLASFDQKKKKEMFACDITYTTNSELGFDYLRDNMVQEYDEKVLRELNFAIIDEGDSVLIDEARTPLIISGQPQRDVSMYAEIDLFAKTFKEDEYKIDAEANSISLTDKGIEKTEKKYKLKSLFAIENSDLVHKLKNALMANFIFQLGVEYIVHDDKILLVDQFTGRVLEGRSYNAGLHQAIQAKEFVKIEPENIIVATITYQSFFRLYKKLAAVSGTAFTEAEEFMKIYNMVVVPVPTNKENIRVDHSDFVFTNKVSKWYHVVAEIEKLHAKQQPVLVGTASVEDSEALAHYLRNKGLPFELLNAKNNAREAEIVANAGQKGAITISTNMAGRGTDIKLGEGVAALGGLYVIGTERHESRRVDNQLRGRCGRQGDEGHTRFFISLEDTLLRRFATEKQEKASDQIDLEYFDSWFFTRLLNSTQKKVEGLNFDTRKNLIDYDSVLSNQRELIYKQRDQILLRDDNINILKKMVEPVVDDLCKTFALPDDSSTIDSPKLTNVLNNQMICMNLIEPETFKDLSIPEVKIIVAKIINLCIDTRIELMGEQALKVLKSIILRNLDNFWTAHLERITKMREGVQLRSLEQRSPLNIYIEEADWHFNQMRIQIARSCLITFFRMFIPNAQQEIHNRLAYAFQGLVISKHEEKEKESPLDFLHKRAPNLKIPANPVNPQDKPFVPKEQKVDQKEDVRHELLKKIKPE